MPAYPDEYLEEVLSGAHTIAVVGAGDQKSHQSYSVMETLKDRGFRVFPVNPACVGATVLDETVRGSLVEITDPVDLVLIFRRAEDAPPFVNQAILLGAKAVWMQLGVVERSAAVRAAGHGLKVVMNRCVGKELERLDVHSAA